MDFEIDASSIVKGPDPGPRPVFAPGCAAQHVVRCDVIEPANKYMKIHLDGPALIE